jgi:hypothetical protein
MHKQESPCKGYPIFPRRWLDSPLQGGIYLLDMFPRALPSATMVEALGLPSTFLACAFKMPRIASQVPGGNQDAKMDHLLQRDRDCRHSSINFSRGFRYGMGSNGSAAPDAAL